MKNFFFGKGIKKRLALNILIAGILPLALGVFLTYFYGIQTLRNSIGANFKEIASETSKKVDTLFKDEIRRINVLASNPDVLYEVSRANQVFDGKGEGLARKEILRLNREWMQAGKKSSLSRDLVSTRLSRYLNQIIRVDDRSVMGILITDRYGGLVAASSPPQKFFFGEDVWWQHVVNRRESVVSNVLSPGQGSFQEPYETIDISTPIIDDQNGEVLGVIKLCYGFNNLLATIMEIRVGETGHAMLFDESGNPLICPILPRNEHRLDADLLANVLSPFPGWTITPDDGHGGYGTVVGFAPVSGVNRLRTHYGNKWYAFIRQDPQETYAPANALLGKVAVMGGLLAGLLALLGLYVGGRITRPIQQLKEGAKLIGEGKLDHRLSLQSKDEVEELASEFNKMAENIKTSQEQLYNFANAVYHTADAVFITNIDGTIFYANPAFLHLTGYSKEEVIGQTPRLLRSGKNDPKIYKEMWRTVLSGKVWKGELINKKKDGTIFHVDLTVAPILDQGGNVINLLGTERDITGRKKLEEERIRWNRELELRVQERTEELRRSEQMRRESQVQILHAEKLASLGRMSAGVAHEIGNPLSSISAITQVLETGEISKEEQVSYLASLRHLVDRIDRIIKSLLTFSRPPVPKLENMHINQVIEEALRVTGPDSRLRKIVVEKKLVPDVPQILGDHDQLIQVFVNLFLNAANAVPKNGKITIETELNRKKDRLFILFSDNGHGIPRESLSRIFDPFYTTKGPGTGTGLGLSICRGIIEGMRGKIEVESGVGKGTCFKLTIPIAQETKIQPKQLVSRL